MNIFVAIPHKFAGCGFYRQYQPHNRLAKVYGIDVLLGAGLYDDNKEFIVEADIIQFHKGYYDLRGLREAKQRGIVTVVDFDDGWAVDTEHLFYKQYIRDGSTQQLIELAREADYVTVTTDLLAEQIRTVNPNVVILPNAMDMDYPNCKNERIKEGFVFGYIGGHCHLKDVELLRGLNNRLRGDYKFRLMGYDKSEVYNKYAEIMFEKGRFDWVEQADIWNYPKMYNYMDVSLVPLVDNKFNSLKSELKLIEAGFFKKAVVVSNVEPYKRLIKHKVNAMVVNKPRDWQKHCQYLIDNPEAVKDLGEALYETIQPYHIDEVNKKRYKFYQDVLTKRDTNSGNGHSRLQAVNR